MSENAPSYETLYSELELTIERLESGDLALEAAVRDYERGMNLAAKCQDLLDHAELRIQQLLDGSIAPFEEA